MLGCLFDRDAGFSSTFICLQTSTLFIDTMIPVQTLKCITSCPWILSSVKITHPRFDESNLNRKFYCMLSHCTIWIGRNRNGHNRASRWIEWLACELTPSMTMECSYAKVADYKCEALSSDRTTRWACNAFVFRRWQARSSSLPSRNDETHPRQLTREYNMSIRFTFAEEDRQLTDV